MDRLGKGGGETRGDLLSVCVCEDQDDRRG